MSAPPCEHCWATTSPRAVHCLGGQARSTSGFWPRRWVARARASNASADIEAVAAQVGISDRTYFDIPITGRLDGQPWTEGIVTDHTFDNSVTTLARMLQAACYITVAFLSGMRDPEIKHLRRGCLSVQQDQDGRVYRWTVHSLAFKGENDPAGVPATWVVGAPAARAINVLHRLRPADTDLLFVRLPHGPGSNSSDETTPLGAGGTNRQLASIIQWVDDYCTTRGRPDTIPLSPDQANCQPLACRNVALTADNITAWHQEIKRIAHELAQRPLLPPLLSQQLRHRRDAITSFLTQHTQDRP